MTKRVQAAQAVGACLNETELLLMFVVASAGESLSLSISELSGCTGKSVGAMRYSVRSLRKKGMIDLSQRFLGNGGQLENEYSLTADGRELLDALLKVDRCVPHGVEVYD